MTFTDAMLIIASFCCVGLIYIDTYPTRDRVISLLRKHEIDWRKWEDDPEANDLETLIEWIHSGEAWLEDHPDRILIIHINVAVITVICHHTGRELVLREFRNGTRRPYSGSLGEKMLHGESAQDAARRGLEEELAPTEPGFSDPSRYSLWLDNYAVEGPRPSNFYPGAFDTYHRRFLTCTIGSDLYHTKYVSRDNGRTICFMWREPDATD